ncbi:MAG: hypothetical protein HQL50_03150 [Magnetococcales bacterium]|nr:hypothetical protein [Magnetococcales bacterium]
MEIELPYQLSALERIFENRVERFLKDSVKVIVIPLSPLFFHTLFKLLINIKTKIDPFQAQHLKTGFNTSQSNPGDGVRERVKRTEIVPLNPCNPLPIKR